MAAIQGSIDTELRASGFKREHQDALDRWAQVLRARCWVWCWVWWMLLALALTLLPTLPAARPPPAQVHPHTAR